MRNRHNSQPAQQDPRPSGSEREAEPTPPPAPVFRARATAEIVGHQLAERRRDADTHRAERLACQQAVGERRAAIATRQERIADLEREVTQIRDEIDRYEVEISDSIRRAEEHAHYQRTAELIAADMEQVLGTFAPATAPVQTAPGETRPGPQPEADPPASPEPPGTLVADAATAAGNGRNGGAVS